MDSRAVSTTLSYTLTLTIATLLVTGLVVAGSDFVNDRREEVVREELAVIGQQVASDLSQADRLVQAAHGGSPTVELRRSYPERVAGSGYRISLDGPNDRVVLESVEPSLSVTVDIRTTSAMGTSAVDGGVVVVTYDSSQLEARNG
ncbi:DUF7266 family protein [Haloarcula salina]|uniref:Uncharacterized protein n=1 Tax=Haloarcula salina TaxID=1429914 RepID=A0AA41G1D5_9EURY|nr:hypothetical protein [Haloarcula salina]MBV0901804.1 hypothetical protein [Haloarcula salina]